MDNIDSEMADLARRIVRDLNFKNHKTGERTELVNIRKKMRRYFPCITDSMAKGMVDLANMYGEIYYTQNRGYVAFFTPQNSDIYEEAIEMYAKDMKIRFAKL